MTNHDLIFIHLSDIHFNKHSSDSYDLDLDLRNEILNDIKVEIINIGRPSGILICGDIAFSGKALEYEKAFEFLKELCDLLKIDETYIFCVPGNHDVDQGIIKSSHGLQKMQSEIETSDNSDDKLSKYLRDELFNKILFSHIHEYNTFAAKFSCNINEKKPTCYIDFYLNDKSTLRLYGLNSIIISSSLDNKDRLMVLGEYQIPSRSEGVTYLSLCHHPPDCWKNGDYLKRRLDERVNIQLYGHKHIFDYSQVVNSLLVSSGATHPSRSEKEWRPRYNWLSIHVEGIDDNRFLKVKLYPRVLNNRNDHFIIDNHICDGGVFREFSLKLDRWNCTKTMDTSIEKNVINAEDEITESKDDKILMNAISNPIRILVYRFLTLSFITRSRILTKFDLVDEEDEGVEHIDMLDKIIQNARNKGKLKELWDEINGELNDGVYIDNPFINNKI